MNLSYPNLTYTIITHKFKKKAKREQLVRVTMCDGGPCGELHQAFDYSASRFFEPCIALQHTVPNFARTSSDSLSDKSRQQVLVSPHLASRCNLPTAAPHVLIRLRVPR